MEKQEPQNCKSWKIAVIVLFEPLATIAGHPLSMLHLLKSKVSLCATFTLTIACAVFQPEVTGGRLETACEGQ